MTPDEFKANYELCGFSWGPPPTVKARRKSDQVLGDLEFFQNPLSYGEFVPDA